MSVRYKVWDIIALLGIIGLGFAATYIVDQMLMQYEPIIASPQERNLEAFRYVIHDLQNFATGVIGFSIASLLIKKNPSKTQIYLLTSAIIACSVSIYCAISMKISFVSFIAEGATLAGNELFLSRVFTVQSAFLLLGLLLMLILIISLSMFINSGKKTHA